MKQTILLDSLLMVMALLSLAQYTFVKVHRQWKSMEIYSSHGLGNYFFLRRIWWRWFLSSYLCSGRYSNSNKLVSISIVLLLLLAVLALFSICENCTQEFFIVVKKHSKLALLPIFFRVKFSSIMFSYLVGKQICRTFPSGTTETRSQLDSSSPPCYPAFPAQHRSTWCFCEGDYPGYRM